MQAIPGGNQIASWGERGLCTRRATSQPTWNQGVALTGKGPVGHMLRTGPGREPRPAQLGGGPATCRQN